MRIASLGGIAGAMSDCYSNNIMLVWLLLLSVLLSDIASSKNANDLPFKTLVEMAVAGFETKQATTFAIPHNQCSGFVAESLLCGTNGVAGAVRVEVREKMSFPSVRVNRELRNVTITRQVDGRGRCPGAALVELRVGCLVADNHRARLRRHALQHLPPLVD